MATTNDIKQAISALQAGQLVAFPTDTVWGLGVAVAYAGSPRAIYQAKQRSSHKPVAWLVGAPDALDVYGSEVPDYARNLAYAFWPGALTLVVKAADTVPDAFQSSEGTIGLRMPAHSTTLELVRQVGPLATSSANLSAQPAPSTAAALPPELVSAAACILDDGSTPAGTASTVVDCTGAIPRILRQGSIEL